MISMTFLLPLAGISSEQVSDPGEWWNDSNFFSSEWLQATLVKVPFLTACAAAKRPLSAEQHASGTAEQRDLNEHDVMLMSTRKFLSLSKQHAWNNSR